jgi:hypothetical protein
MGKFVWPQTRGIQPHKAHKRRRRNVRISGQVGFRSAKGTASCPAQGGSFGFLGFI